MFDYIIVGAGFAGAVMADNIARQLNKKVLIIEKRNHIAGNCHDFKDENNILIHKYGPHLFHTNKKEVVSYLSKFSKWDIYNHKVKAMIDGNIVPIPFNLNTLYELFPDTLASKLENKLLTCYEYNTKIPILELKKSTDIDLQFLADYIYDKIFVNYTAKQWGMKPEEMDSAVTARVPIFIGRDNRYFNDIYQLIPSQGYTKLFESMLAHTNIKLMLNTNFHDVCHIKNNKVYFLDREFNGKLIYTGQLDELFEYKFGNLPYRSVQMKFETVDTEYYQEVATINYPNNYDFTRITEFKHIHFIESAKSTILKEYPEKYVVNKNTPYYPIFTDESKKRHEQYIEYSKNFKNLILLGRLAEYKYYDMDDIVERALEVFEREIKNNG